MPRRLNMRMGMCLPCLGGAADDVVVTPDPETRRRQLAEAAEKRQKRQRTGASKIQKQLKGKGRNKKKLTNRR